MNGLIMLLFWERAKSKNGNCGGSFKPSDTYSEAGLVKPLLYDLFSNSDYKPRATIAAKEYLKNLISKA